MMNFPKRLILLFVLQSMMATDASKGEVITAADRAAIELATRELVRRGLPSADYRARVLRESSGVTVVFLDSTARPGGRGNTGLLPGIEVQLSRDEQRIERSSLIR